MGRWYRTRVHRQALSRRLAEQSGMGTRSGSKYRRMSEMMPLYHFSEEPNIQRFVPRPPLARPEVEPLVWAIDAWHAPTYYVPRDCPRVAFWPLPTTTDEDRQRWFRTVTGQMVIAIESAWLERLRATRLYRYVMPEESFAPLVTLEEGKRYFHGVHVSRDTVIPLRVEPVGDLLEALTAADIELRICPSL